MVPEAVLVVFAKLPVPGRAKTRLASTVGAEAAAHFYKLCAQLIFYEAHSCDVAQAMLCCSTSEEVEDMQQWLSKNNTPMVVSPQLQAPDLGQRMLAAMTHAAGIAKSQPIAPAARTAASQQAAPAAGQHVATVDRNAAAIGAATTCSRAVYACNCGSTSCAAVLVVGTDIPDLSAAVINAAVCALAHYDMVLGPARDGGFYLLGLRVQTLLTADVQAGKLFEGVTWSTASVLQRTAAAAVQLDVKLAPLDTLPILRDIDTLVDLRSWLADCQVRVPNGEQQQQQHSPCQQRQQQQQQQQCQQKQQHGNLPLEQQQTRCPSANRIQVLVEYSSSLATQHAASDLSDSAAPLQSSAKSS